MKSIERYRAPSLMVVCALCLAAWPLLKALRGQTGGSPAPARKTAAPSAASKAAPARAGVRMWEEDVVIPTYAIGDPEPNPMFLLR